MQFICKLFFLINAGNVGHCIWYKTVFSHSQAISGKGIVWIKAGYEFKALYDCYCLCCKCKQFCSQDTTACCCLQTSSSVSSSLLLALRSSSFPLPVPALVLLDPSGDLISLNWGKKLCVGFFFVFCFVFVFSVLGLAFFSIFESLGG